MWPHRRQPTRLRRPWDSQGKNTGVGWYFLLQCRKVKSESEVAQSCLTLRDPIDSSPPGSSVHGIFQARVLERGAIAFSRGSSQPRDGTRVSHIAGRRVTLWASREAVGLELSQWKTKNTALDTKRDGLYVSLEQKEQWIEPRSLPRGDCYTLKRDAEQRDLETLCWRTRLHTAESRSRRRLCQDRRQYPTHTYLKTPSKLGTLLVPRHLCLRALLGVVGYPFLPTWLACVVFWMCTICDSWIECWLLVMYLQCRDSYPSLLPGPATNRYSGRWPK